MFWLVVRVDPVGLALQGHSAGAVVQRGPALQAQQQQTAEALTDLVLAAAAAEVCTLTPEVQPEATAVMAVMVQAEL
ncbi:hypothetical protein [Pantoea sp. UYEF8]|uniref:hypothetical protein n=1 Tax=Pantoea sp. UYEF8 TaxID=1756394 RepID=UPI003392434D